jgi:pyridinium-3,5-bisthiocarboxylic acid mononucleotide nickel chelatase
MKLYLECNMGAAGDMLMAALLELLPDREAFLIKMNRLGIPGLHIECVPSKKCGILGSHVSVRVNGGEETVRDASMDGTGADGHDSETPDHDKEFPQAMHAHSHTSYPELCGRIEKLDLPEKVRADAAAVYRIIGEAESEVHSVPLEQIHFHEVGTMDALADVVGCCLLIDMLGVREISASPVHVGSGFVRTAHGVLPVPAPATANILRGVPVYGGKIRGELCTPTGAAILRHFVKRFGDMEPMAVRKIGYGMGTKDFEAANCVRAFLGDAADGRDEIVEITCNLDDMTPEAIGEATGRLLEKGALDVFTVPIYMKKNRPAVMLTCLCRPEDEESLAQLTLLHTTTLGVRIHACRRKILTASFSSVETPYGAVRVKKAEGCGVSKAKPEYEDVALAARKFDVPFLEVYRQAAAAIAAEQQK